MSLPLQQRQRALREKLKNRYGVRPLRQTLPALAEVSHGPLADSLWQLQGTMLEDMISCLFGYHLLEMSAFDVADLSVGSTINHRFRLAPALAGRSALPAGLAQGEALPLAPESIDVALLHHVLEYSARPQQVLKEVAQSVVPHGHLVIVGFNPLSAMGLWKFTSQIVTRNPFWRRHGLRLGRVIDWLHLLDFEPVDIRQGFFGLPLNRSWAVQRQRVFDRLGTSLGLGCGGFYIIVARKNVCGFISAKPKWEPLSPVLGLVQGRPSARGSRPVQPSVRQRH